MAKLCLSAVRGSAFVFFSLNLACQPNKTALSAMPSLSPPPVLNAPSPLTPSPVKTTHQPSPEPTLIVLPPPVLPSARAGAPSVPSRLELIAAARGSDRVTLQWNTPGSALIYTVEINGRLVISGLEQATYTAIGLLPDTLQTIVVRAFKSRSSQSQPLAEGKLEVRTLAGGSSGGSSGGGSGNNGSSGVPTLPLIELRRQWSVEPEGQVLIHQAPALTEDGHIYFALFPASLLAYDQSGTSLWQASLAGTPKTSPVIDAQGYLYLGVYPGAIQSYNTQGDFQWSIDLTGDSPVGLALSPDGQTLYAVTEQGRILAWSLPARELLWQNSMNGRGITAPVVNQGVLYVGNSNGSWYALNASTGEQKWRFLAGDFQQNAYPLVDRLRVYLPQATGFIYALDHRGFQQWVYKANARLRGSPIQDGQGHLFFVADDNTVSALSSAGQLLWKQSLGQAATDSSPVLDALGNLYVAALNDLLVYDKNGKLLAKTLLNENTTGALTLDGQGILYVLGVSGRLRTYQSLGGGLPREGWPKAFRDARNQGFRAEEE